jgi:hypothetical protein
MAALRQAIADVVAEDPPMTVRQVFYQLVARGVIEKTEDAYQHTIIKQMTNMRLDGSLPFDSVIDETRRVRVTQTFRNIEDAIEQTADFYRRSALAESDCYLEIWCEKDALAGVMWDVVSDYDVPLLVSRGMPSLTFLYGSACAIKRAAEQDKSTYIYQFGDHDPSGVLIPQVIKRRLDELCERLDCPPPYVERVALTEEQIEEFAGDSVELDALPPRDLRAMVTTVIESHISAAKTALLRIAEDSERELLRTWRPGEAP